MNMHLSTNELPRSFDEIFASIPKFVPQHSPISPAYKSLQPALRHIVEEKFSSSEASANFGPYGKIHFPYFKMGNIDSLNLFDLDEILIFSFYWINRRRYKNALDIGANIGLHSLLLAKCGFHVTSYEPDPKHVEIFKRNLDLNQCKVDLRVAAVSDHAGKMEFVRVLGNTTGSHLSGSKANPYGELERFPVTVEPIQEIIAKADLMKLDAEGHEKQILLATKKEHWTKLDAFVEIGNESNARAIYEHLTAFGLNLFAQKTGWKKVRSLEDMPTSRHDGSLFISRSPQMTWEP